MSNNRNASAQELAESVLSLYDVSVARRDEIIKRIYLPDATFSDALVSVKGVENIQAQFRCLPRFIKSSKATLLRGAMAGSSVLTIDSTQVYRLKPFPSFMKVTIRTFSVLELKNGRVATHTDHFDLHSVLSNIPIVSFLYNQFRPLFGATSSAIINRLLPAEAEEEQVSPKSTEKSKTMADVVSSGTVSK